MKHRMNFLCNSTSCASCTLQFHTDFYVWFLFRSELNVILLLKETNISLVTPGVAGGITLHKLWLKCQQIMVKTIIIYDNL